MIESLRVSQPPFIIGAFKLPLVTECGNPHSFSNAPQTHQIWQGNALSFTMDNGSCYIGWVNPTYTRPGIGHGTEGIALNFSSKGKRKIHLVLRCRENVAYNSQFEGQARSRHDFFADSGLLTQKVCCKIE